MNVCAMSLSIDYLQHEPPVQSKCLRATKTNAMRYIWCHIQIQININKEATNEQ